MKDASFNIEGYVNNPPSLPLPPAIYGNEVGTWAYDTLTRRYKDDILVRIFEENNLKTEKLKECKTEEKLNILKNELINVGQTPLSFLEEDGGDDLSVWVLILKKYVQNNVSYLDAPWLVSEFYFYRRVLSAFDYFHTHLDPFGLQKRRGIEAAKINIHYYANKTYKLCLNNDKDENDITTEKYEDIDEFKKFIRDVITDSLWINQMDLSLFPLMKNHIENNNKHNFCSPYYNYNICKSNEEEDTKQENENKLKEVDKLKEERNKKFLLADDFDSFWDDLIQLTDKGKISLRCIDIITDNAGMELLADMHLADFLIIKRITRKVIFRLKNLPTFVSDATKFDFLNSIDIVREQAQSIKTESMVKRWLLYIQNSQWELKPDHYWNMPFAFWEMPNTIFFELQKNSDFVFVKGDCNYRRLLGDRRWEMNTKFHKVLSYFPTRIVALRMLKADMGCGMTVEKTEAAANEDKNFMINGKWGVLQYFNPYKNKI